MSGRALQSQEAQNLPEPTSQTVLLQSLCDAWATNLASFDRKICKYELTRTHVESTEQLEEQSKHQSRGFAKCDWRRNGAHQLLTILADDASNPETIVDGQDGFRYGLRAYGSQTLLLDGQLWMSIRGQYGTIHTSGGNVPQSLTPFTLAAVPTSFSESSGPAPPTITVLGTEGQTRQIEVRTEYPDSSKAEYQFDMTRGGLLTRLIYGNDAGETRIEVQEYQESGNATWFPMRIRRTILAKESPDEILVDICRVTQLKADLHEDELDLSIEFSLEGGINVPSLGNMAMTKVAATRRIGPEDLNSFLQECEATQAIGRLHVPAQESQPMLTTRQSVISRHTILAAIVVGLAASMLLYWRDLRAASK